MFRVAFRNIFRNRRRTIVTFILMTVGSVIFSFFRFFSNGIHQDRIWHAVALDSGILQVAANGWLENPVLERALDVNDALLDSLHVEGVTAISPRIQGSALLSYGENSRFVSVLAADPELEKKITKIHERMIQGKYLKNDEKAGFTGIVGFKLARNMGITTGSTVYLVTSQFDGSMGAIPVTITGIYQAIDPELDMSHIMITTAAGRELFAPDSPEKGIRRYTNIVLAVKDYRVARAVYATLSKRYPLPALKPGESREDSRNYDPVLLNWKDLNPGVVQMVLLDEIQNDLFYSFLVIIMAFGILNNVQMSIHERMRELGILLAIGTKPRDLHRMVLFEVLLVLLPSLLTGTFIGMGLGFYFNAHPIVMTGDVAQAYIDLGFEPVLRCIVDMPEIGIAVLSLLIPSLLLALVAARRIFRLNPVEIINTI